MGLKETIQNVAKTAIESIGNIAVTITYTDINNPTYNDVTKQRQENTTEYTGLSMVKDALTVDDLNVAGDLGINVVPTDLKGYVPYIDLQIEPSPKDTVKEFDEDGNEVAEYNVIGRMIDPADALHILILRKI